MKWEPAELLCLQRDRRTKLLKFFQKVEDYYRHKCKPFQRFRPIDSTGDKTISSSERIVLRLLKISATYLGLGTNVIHTFITAFEWYCYQTHTGLCLTRLSPRRSVTRPLLSSCLSGFVALELMPGAAPRLPSRCLVRKADIKEDAPPQPKPANHQRSPHQAPRRPAESTLLGCDGAGQSLCIFCRATQQQELQEFRSWSLWVISLCSICHISQSSDLRETSHQWI